MSGELILYKVCTMDYINSKFLRNKDFNLLFQASLDPQKIPNARREVLVIPIYKAGKRDKGTAKYY